MPDFLSKEARSALMSKIRSKDTKPELRMAELLEAEGLRFQRYADLPGKPDFVLGKVVVFVDGTFWHGRNFARWSSKLKPFWYNKITNNMRRDRRVDRKLRRMGFKIVHLWEDDVWKRHSVCLRKVKRSVLNGKVDSVGPDAGAGVPPQESDGRPS